MIKFFVQLPLQMLPLLSHMYRTQQQLAGSISWWTSLWESTPKTIVPDPKAYSSNGKPPQKDDMKGYLEGDNKNVYVVSPSEY